MVRILLPKGVDEAGFATSGTDGLASITFSKTYPVKPKISLTPDLSHAVDCIIIQIEGWTQDVEGNYIGMNVYTANDGGRTEPNVPFHYMVVK